MELAYIWTDKFKVLSNFSCKFCSDIDVDINNNIFSIKELDDKRDPFKGFYGKGIKDLKVIVGENGSGKSTVMELIKILCCTAEKDIKRRSPDSFNAFVLFRESKDKYFYLAQGNVPFEKSIKGIKKETIKKDGERINGLEFVYYSNLFEYGEKLKNNYPSLFDISTIGEVKSSFHSLENEMGGEITYDFVADYFNNSEINRQVELVFSKKIKTPFKLPEKLNLSIAEIDSLFDPYIPDSSYSRKDRMILKGISSFISQFDYEKQMPVKYNNQDAFKYSLLKTALVAYIKEKSQNTETGVALASYKVEDEIIYKVITEITTQNIDEKFIQFFELFKNYSDYYVFDGKKLHKALCDISIFLSKKGTLLNDKSAFYFSRKDKTDEEFRNILEKYFNLNFFPTIINFKWYNLSSGEIQFLNLLSRINELKVLSDSKNVVFMIDEGEITLHPEWQRQYVKFIVDNLTTLFPNTEFQLILSTHSPIILSDILDQDIKYLGKKNDSIKTFGANIYELYSRSFAMNYVMGDYARKKIEELLGDLFKLKNASEKNSIKINQAKYTELEQTINVIGDEPIRLRLLEILDAIPNNFTDLTKELNMAKKRVQELEKRMENEKI